MFFGVVVVLCFLRQEVRGDVKGIRLCKRECRLLKGCSAIRYDPVNLICTKLTNKQSGSKAANKDVVFVAKDMPADALLKTCQVNDVILFNKWTKPVCVPTGPTPVAEDVRHRRMLIIPKDSNKKFGLAIDPANHWDVAKIESSLGNISAVVHLKKMKRLLIAIKQDVLISNLRLQQVTVFKRGLSANKLCVDEQQKLVFVLRKGKRRWYLKRVYYSKKEIIKFSVSAFNIEIDTKFKAVYALSGSRLFSSSYEGRITNTISRRMRGTTGLACTPGLIYYSSRKTNILMTITKSGHLSKIGSFRLPNLPLCNVVDMKVFVRYLYISCFVRYNVIIRVDLFNPKHVTGKILMHSSLTKGFLLAGEMRG